MSIREKRKLANFRGGSPGTYANKTQRKELMPLGSSPIHTTPNRGLLNPIAAKLNQSLVCQSNQINLYQSAKTFEADLDEFALFKCIRQRTAFHPQPVQYGIARNGKTAQMLV